MALSANTFSSVPLTASLVYDTSSLPLQPSSFIIAASTSIPLPNAFITSALSSTHAPSTSTSTPTSSPISSSSSASSSSSFSSLSSSSSSSYTSAPSPTPQRESSATLSTAAIIGIAIGVCLLLLIILLVITYLRITRRRQNKQTQWPHVPATEIYRTSTCTPSIRRPSSAATLVTAAAFTKTGLPMSYEKSLAMARSKSLNSTRSRSSSILNPVDVEKPMSFDFDFAALRMGDEEAQHPPRTGDEKPLPASPEFSISNYTQGPPDYFNHRGQTKRETGMTARTDSVYSQDGAGGSEGGGETPGWEEMVTSDGRSMIMGSTRL